MVHVKPAMPVVGAVALSMALSLSYRSAYGQNVPGGSEAPATTAGSPTASSETDKSDATTIVVTGTRITPSGFTAPTPTTMVNSEELQKSAEPNIFTSIAELQALWPPRNRSDARGWSAAE